MKDDWLLGVIREIEDFARSQNLPELFPLVEQAYEAARSELAISPPENLQLYRLHREMAAKV